MSGADYAQLSFEHAPVGMAWVDRRDHRILRANLCFQRLVSRKGEDLQKTPVLELFRSEDHDRLKRTLLDGGEIELRLSDSWIRLNATPIAQDSADGFVLVTVSEIMSQKLMESVLHQMPIGAVVRDLRSDRMIMTNQRARTILRMSEGAADFSNGVLPYRILRRDGSPLAVEEWPTSRAMKGETIRSEALSVAFADGSRGYVRAGAAPIRDSDGEVIASVAIIDDVTEEKKIRDHQRVLASALESSPGLVGLASPEGKVFFLNAAGRARLGIGQLESVDQISIPEFLAKEDQAKLENAGGKWHGELLLTGRDGSRIPFAASLCLVQDEEMERPIAIALLGQDLTERKKNEELREKFVTILTHDLRNPLSSAKLSSQLILRAPEQTEKVAALAARVLSGINRADQMIQDLLDAQLIRAGHRLPLKPMTGDLSQWVTEVVADLRILAGTRLHLDTQVDIRGTWCAQSVRRAVENLVTNAVKYGDSTSPVSVQVRSEERGGGRAIISVHNFGQVLTPEEQTRLFQPFERSWRAKASGKTGWGLGLTLVQGVAEAHGGRVTVSSTPEAGTAFTIELPQVQLNQDLNIPFSKVRL